LVRDACNARITFKYFFTSRRNLSRRLADRLALVLLRLSVEKELRRSARNRFKIHRKNFRKQRSIAGKHANQSCLWWKPY
jgi:hypothetical protein